MRQKRHIFWQILTNRAFLVIQIHVRKWSETVWRFSASSDLCQISVRFRQEVYSSSELRQNCVRITSDLNRIIKRNRITDIIIDLFIEKQQVIYSSAITAFASASCNRPSEYHLTSLRQLSNNQTWRTVVFHVKGKQRIQTNAIAAQRGSDAAREQHYSHWKEGSRRCVTWKERAWA